ncbi:putative hydrolases or acyltransferases (alpha/beta hydrolase superfamily) [Archaeoglobus sulfaticallidus PM70-1]|uniref:Putative hydrolases or acyltransferases (Alpha/beta hydrolase superfamily) n=1 Tax=Archaeoglobus sulfaticallidus PM70-1 TaxID=387631 RepID=N0BFQ3_9EURY|nr:alpha/beta hydrolase [Archaeoglobus sulfaticallidus]AGK61858.1 putative hydrolases or acyltransferases (alpha/beta hydrolase superfamily) [Archaeoglobus sulfaticallidus PM70-1]
MDVNIKIHRADKDLPVLYIHGSGSNSKIWKNQLEAIGGYAIDLPGHGESDDANIETVEDYARYVLEAMEEKGLDRMFIAGHSLGGAIAQMVYLIDRSRVMGLILVGTGARLRVLDEILEGLKNDFDTMAKKLVNMLFSRKFSDSRIKDEVLKDLLSCGSRITHRDFSACDKFDLLSDYKEGKVKVDVPVLCIVGSDDIMTPVKYSEFFRKTIGAEVKVIEDAGHMVMIEKPDEVNSTILEFVKSKS